MNFELLKDVLANHRTGLDGLSRKTGVDVQRLHSLAEGVEPTLKEWRVLAKALKLSPRSLAESDEGSGRYSFLFRSPVNGKRVTRALLSQLSSKMMLSDELRPRNAIAGIAALRGLFVPPANYLDAEANALIFRRVFVDDDQLRPLTDLPEIVSRTIGVRIFLIDTPGIEGASVVTSDDAFIFLARRFQPRMLFTLAHEIAHVFFHQSGETDFVSLDFDSGQRGEVITRSASKDELYAHAFASALLMPDVAIGRMLKKIREQFKATGPLGDIEINWLAHFFGVSFLAAAVRCESLRLLPPGGASSLDEWVKKEFGSAEKRATEVGIPERQSMNFPYFPPDLLEAAMSRIRDGSLSIGRASSELGITVADLISANEQMVH